MLENNSEVFHGQRLQMFYIWILLIHYARYETAFFHDKSFSIDQSISRIYLKNKKKLFALSAYVKETHLEID